MDVFSSDVSSENASLCVFKKGDMLISKHNVEHLNKTCPRYMR